MKLQNKELKLALLKKEYAAIEDELNDKLVDSFLLNSSTEYDLLVESIIVSVNLLNNGRIYLEVTANCKKWNPYSTNYLGNKKVSITSYQVFKKDVYKKFPGLGHRLVRETVSDVKIPKSGWLD